MKNVKPGEVDAVTMNLYPFQKAGRDFLAARNVALLADQMRLGKSIQSIAAADQIGACKILVVCPASARVVWGEQWKKWQTKSRYVTVGHPGVDITGRDRIGMSVLIIGYTRPEDELPEQEYDLVIVDECHYLKTASAERTKRIYRIIKTAPRVWFLSGTPCPNGNYAEMWPILRMTGRCGYTYSDFVEKFCKGYQPARGDFRITGHKPGADEAIAKMLDGFMLRRKLVDVWPDLPPVHTEFYPVERPPNVEFDEMLDGRVHVAASVGGFYLDSELTTWRRLTGLAKVRGVVEVVKQELEAGLDKIVLFAWHKEVIEGLREGLKKYSPVVIVGSTSPESRKTAVEQFKTSPKVKVFIGNIQAAGEALDLSVACEVGFVELGWNPGTNDQPAARVQGINQKRPVRIRIFTLHASADGFVSRVIARKTQSLNVLF